MAKHMATTLRKTLAKVLTERDRIEMAAIDKLLSAGRGLKGGGRKPGPQRARKRRRRRTK